MLFFKTLELLTVETDRLRAITVIGGYTSQLYRENNKMNKLTTVRIKQTKCKINGGKLSKSKEKRNSKNKEERSKLVLLLVSRLESQIPVDANKMPYCIFHCRKFFLQFSP